MKYWRVVTSRKGMDLLVNNPVEVCLDRKVKLRCKPWDKSKGLHRIYCKLMIWSYNRNNKYNLI